LARWRVMMELWALRRTSGCKAEADALIDRYHAMQRRAFHSRVPE